MKHLLLTTIAAVVMVGNAFADPIHDAAWGGDLAGVQAELDKGVDVNVKDDAGLTPLDWVRLFRNLTTDSIKNDISNLLRKHGGKYSSIHTAARADDAEGVREHIVSGADVNAKDSSEWTALHWASQEGYFEVSKVLIDSGADIELKSEGWTPLHCASGNGLFLSVMYQPSGIGHVEIAKLLILKGSDVNATHDRFGNTPLHEAAERGNLEVVELLIESGAYINAQLTAPRDVFFTYSHPAGTTPIDLAIKRSRTDVVTVLRKYGGYKTGYSNRLILHHNKDKSPNGFKFLRLNTLSYEAQATQNFKNWVTLEKIKAVTGNTEIGEYFEFVDPRRPLIPFKQNFYRVKVIE